MRLECEQPQLDVGCLLLSTRGDRVELAEQRGARVTELREPLVPLIELCWRRLLTNDREEHLLQPNLIVVARRVVVLLRSHHFDRQRAQPTLNVRTHTQRSQTRRWLAIDSSTCGRWR